TASCFGTISWVNEALYEYRQHGNNTLGAKKAGSVRDMTERLDRASQVEENYRKMAAQAHAFGKQYQEMMSEEQKAVLRAYLALRYQSPAGRLRNIWRNRFFKSSRLQTLAQCVTIPRPDGENRPV
ncbi:MAG: glycosyltransferase family 2 protein, partial [Bacillota bacterium]|nr:glycosyltransferase family 2 protein [Bacillota bacterium]